MEEARDEFWTDINAIKNDSKSCKSDTKRDSKESLKYRELMEMYMEGRLDYLFGGRRDLRQRLGAAER